MKRSATIAVLLGLLLAAPSAGAYWQSRLQVSVGSAGYVGPGDIVGSAKAWWGLRGYSAAYSTGSNPSADIIRASDSATTTINILATGAFDTATATTFCNATTCKVSKLYDQTGGTCHLVQATGAAQPALTFSGIGSLPVITWDGVTGPLKAATNCPTGAQPYSYSVAVKIVANTTGDILFGFATGGRNNFSWTSGTSKFHLYAGTDVDVTPSPSVGTWNAVQIIWNGASSSVNYNGTAVTLNPGSTTLTGPACISNCNSPGPINALWGEAGIWGGSFSAGNITSMTANQQTYWGF